MQDQWRRNLDALNSLQTNGTAVPDIETRLEAKIKSFWQGRETGETYDLCFDALAEIRRLRANSSEDQMKEPKIGDVVHVRGTVSKIMEQDDGYPPVARIGGSWVSFMDIVHIETDEEAGEFDRWMRDYLKEQRK